MITKTVIDPAQIVAFIRQERESALSAARLAELSENPAHSYGWKCRAQALLDVLREIPDTTENLEAERMLREHGDL